MKRIRISFPSGPDVGHDVVIGAGLLDALPEHGGPVAGRVAVIADATVAGLYGARVLDAFRRAGARADLFPFPAGEAHKARSTWAELTDALLERGVGRDGLVVALGGGVTTDLAGFVAATYMRGVPVVHAPTTLLAMIDAAIGGKTGVDTDHGKNLVGAFHPPALVVADLSVLETLPDDELRAGLAEAVKHGAIADDAYLAALGRDAAAVFARDAAALERLVAGSVAVKARFVGADPGDRGVRQALNFGHTVGHALEAAAGYGIAHGFAVAIGMVAEAEAGAIVGVTEPGAADALRAALTAFGLPVRLPDGADPATILEATRYDKKSRRQRVRYALIQRPGAMARGAAGEWTLELDDDVVRTALARVLP